MTGKAFIKRLALQLDFLNENDRETVLDFYRAKIDSADTLVQEEKIVASFGVPETIAIKLKEAYFTEDPPEEDQATLQNNIEEEATSSSDSNQTERMESEEPFEEESDSEKQSEADFNSTEEANAEEPMIEEEIGLNGTEESPCEENEEESVIFSKNLNPEKAPEVIQALENKEIKTLYGEKVIIQEREEPIETFELDPIDMENNLTAEEIQEAKAVTLEKAEQYSAGAFGNDSDSASEEELFKEELKPKKPISIEETEVDTPVKEKKQIKGLFTKMFENSGMPKGLVLFFEVLLSVLISPILLLISLAMFSVYAIGTLALAFASLAMALILLALIAFAVIEIIHGLVLLFDNVVVALIEIGMATVLFGIVCALTALIYEFIFAVTPKAIKKFTLFFARCMKNIFAYLYGGNA